MSTRCLRTESLAGFEKTAKCSDMAHLRMMRESGTSISFASMKPSGTKRSTILSKISGSSIVLSFSFSRSY